MSPNGAFAFWVENNSVMLMRRQFAAPKFSILRSLRFAKVNVEEQAPICVSTSLLKEIVVELDESHDMVKVQLMAGSRIISEINCCNRVEARKVQSDVKALKQLTVAFKRKLRRWPSMLLGIIVGSLLTIVLAFWVNSMTPKNTIDARWQQREIPPEQWEP